ncbi:hypothetical protein [Priestia endophytica]|uniref:Uncharacterized protein n=1 Tax=Priestia endophytica DSM 13796 TaxID=1121089 RepID=A0A1I5YQQ2_9BACI|nr:hypothetical protein [Priestia endophytica]KYG33612.1 hypothetical protein AZF06_21035 [Priestia endophytica]SFQ46400.1 hypothetical protein SAMN02745910_01481 [Priestia endophytica DSM 13796]
MKALKDYKYNLRRKRSWMFSLIMAFMFVGFFTFLTSKVYIASDEKLYHTEMGKTLDLSSSGTVMLEKRTYYPAQHQLEMVLKMDQIDEEDFQFKAQEKANSGVDLPIKVLYQDDGYYVVRVKQLSSNWEALAFDLYQKPVQEESVDVEGSEEKTEEEEPEDELVQTISSDQSKTSTSPEKSSKNMQAYGLLVVEIQQKEVKKKMKSYEKAIGVEMKNQRALRKEIGELKADMEYQIETEKAETEAQISLKEDEIRMKEESINLYKEEKKMLKEKLKKLNEKEQDLAPTH